LRTIHRHLFQDVYTWAGALRTVRISKGGTAFCFPENLDREMGRLFADLAKQKNLSGPDADSFADEAARQSTLVDRLNSVDLARLRHCIYAIHPRGPHKAASFQLDTRLKKL
jgi:cell filamentation protein